MVDLLRFQTESLRFQPRDPVRRVPAPIMRGLPRRSPPRDFAVGLEGAVRRHLFPVTPSSDSTVGSGRERTQLDQHQLVLQSLDPNPVRLASIPLEFSSWYYPNCKIG